MTIKDYSTTANSNTALNGINVSEGMAPSLVNNFLRSSMADQKSQWNDKEWFVLGNGDTTNTYTRASSTSVTIGADVTGTHHVGRRVKIVDTNTGEIFGKIATSSYSSPNTTITFTFDSGSIHASDSNPVLYLGSTYVGPSTPVVDEDDMASDSAIIPPSQQSVKAFVESGTSTLTNKTLTSPVINTGVSGTAIQDDDNFSSASASKLASSESIKAYVDAQLDSQDVDITTDSGTIAIDLDDETLTITGGSGIDTSATGNTVTITHGDTSNVNGTAGQVGNSNGTVTQNINITMDSNGHVTALNSDNTNLDTRYYTKSSFDSNNFTDSSGTLSVKDATTSVKGISSFSTNDFSVSSGAVSVKTAGVSDSQLASGIDATKIGNGDVTNTELSRINSVSENVQTSLDGKVVKTANLSDLASSSTARTNLGLGSISTQASNNVSITGGSISGLSNPSSGSEPATKTYTDNLIAGMKTRIICRVATTGNVDLTADLQNGDTIDGVTIATGNQVLVKNQGTASQNGIYTVVSSGTSERSTDFDSMAEISGQMVIIQEGSTNDNKIFLCTTNSDATLNSDSISFTQVTPSNTGTVSSAGLTQSGSEFTISGTPITSSGNITIDVNRISATKIGANTNISDTEFGYLNNVSSNIQTQLDAKATTGFSTAIAIALS